MPAYTSPPRATEGVTTRLPGAEPQFLQAGAWICRLPYCPHLWSHTRSCRRQRRRLCRGRRCRKSSPPGSPQYDLLALRCARQATSWRWQRSCWRHCQCRRQLSRLPDDEPPPRRPLLLLLLCRLLAAAPSAVSSLACWPPKHPTSPLLPLLLCCLLPPQPPTSSPQPPHLLSPPMLLPLPLLCRLPPLPRSPPISPLYFLTWRRRRRCTRGFDMPHKRYR